MTFKEYLEKKNARLKTVPDELLSRIERFQKKLYSRLIAIVDDLTREGGFLKADAQNLRKQISISSGLKDDLFGDEYLDIVNDYIKEFDAQSKINDLVIKKQFKEFDSSEFAKVTLEKSKLSAHELLLDTPLETEFLKPLDELLTNSITSGASWNDTVQNIRDFVEGNEDVDGRLLNYSKQIAHDAFAEADRSYTNAVADDLESEWFLYSGGELPTSRCFCDERHEKYFHYKEVEAWGRGENIGDCRSGDLWAGANRNTNEKTIFIYAGGYNCEHSIMPVSVFSVPKSVLQRNIESGNYNPSEGERELLGL